MSFLDERIAYGREIRQRATQIINVYGELAVERARRAADEPGIPAAERSFRAAVAERIARATAAVTPLPS